MNEFEKLIVTKLDTLIKLTALNALRGRELKEQVLILDRMGYQPKEIAEILGKTPNHISVALYEIRKRRGKNE